jgi:hypothetical protein
MRAYKLSAVQPDTCHVIIIAVAAAAATCCADLKACNSLVLHAAVPAGQHLRNSSVPAAAGSAAVMSAGGGDHMWREHCMCQPSSMCC